MWDLTIPGNHDFYIQTATTAVLVHSVGCPNSDGRLGGPAHQAKVDQIAEQVEKSGLTPSREFTVRTPGGFKSMRSVDVAALDENGVPQAFYQVGRQTTSGFPVMRESQAIWDI